MKKSIEDAARSACEACGVQYRSTPADGKFHTADLIDDPKGKNDGRIKIFLDRQGGIVWNHKGDCKTFFVDGKPNESLPQAERNRIQRDQLRRAAELQQRYDRAATRARAIWQAAKPAPADHPYLIRKRIKPHGARIGVWRRTLPDDSKKHHTLLIEHSLILPLYNQSGIIRSLQAIFPEKNQELARDRDFLPGGAVAGLFYWIGGRSSPVCLAEGFSTAATIHEATGYRVYIAFTAGNLINIARLIRQKLPETDLIMCADNDTGTSGNPGLTYATKAALAVDARLAIPPIAGDFNDFAKESSLL